MGHADVDDAGDPHGLLQDGVDEVHRRAIAQARKSALPDDLKFAVKILT